MKKYENPEFEIIDIEEDVVANSPTCPPDINPVGEVDGISGTVGC